MYLPPLNALRAFEAAARHLSFKKAGEELYVTQGAISRHVMHLEDTLGLKLFARHHKRVALTPDGERYSHEIHLALAAIARATASCMSVVDDAVLKVKVPPTCAIRWLMPRLQRFHETYPAFSVQITTSHEPFDPDQDVFDVALQYGLSHSDLVDCELLFSEILIPVCTEEFARHSRINSSADIVRQVLLKSVLRPLDWPRWFKMVGANVDRSADRQIVLENASLTYEAAEKGFGIALGQAAFVVDELELGRLIAPVGGRLVDETGYYLLVPRERARLRKVRAFRRWIAGEAAATRKVLERFPN